MCSTSNRTRCARYEPPRGRVRRSPAGPAGRRLVGALLVGALTIAGALEAVVPRPAAADETPSKKRGPPPAPPSVSAKGIRYQAIPWGRRRGLDQNGGYIAAVDEATGHELWLLRVYAIPQDPEMEADKQDLFISRLALADGGRTLLVTDERGGRYRVDLSSRAVTRP